MQLEKVKKASLTDRVTEILYEKIIGGEIMPGERLPSETELAEMLGVGRPTIREAINRLIGLGLVMRGDYTMMVSPNASMSTRASLTPLFLENWEGRDLYQARILVEEDLVELVIENATLADLAKLREINDRLLDVHMSETGYYDADMDFHNCIAEISGNQIMVEISRIVNNMFQRYKPQVEKLYEVQRATHHDHELLIDAISNNDLSEARTIIRRSLGGSEKALKEMSY